MSDFATFKKAFKGDLVTPNDPDYPQAIFRWAINACRRAQVVAFVRDSEDVALAITYARKAGLPLAIRGGGHNPAGASSSENGLVIDLSRYINHVKIDADRKLAHAGGGALWGAVDEAAIQHGLATVGGTVNHTGIGGLIAGGGYGWLSGEHGLAIDNLVQATVVIADGSILTASETENPDLFWGIRGGGSNFGVITEFVLKLHPQRRTVFAGPLIFTPAQGAAVAAAVDAWWKRGPSAKEALLHFYTEGPDGNPCIVTNLFYNGPEDEGRRIFKSLIDLGPILDQATDIPYEKLNTLQNPMVAHGHNAYMKGSFIPIEYNKDDAAAVLDAAVKAFQTREYHGVLVFEYYPAAKINSIPRGATPYQRDHQPSVLSVLMWDDDTPEKSQKAKKIAYELIGIATKSGPEAMGYGNYNSESDAVSIDGAPVSKAAALFGENYPRLQEIKKKYDPDAIFNKWFVITPAA